MKHVSARGVKSALIVILGVVVAFLPPPDGVTTQGMHMAGIFVATILALILQPLPTASVSLIGISIAMLTGAMTKKEALAGFGNSAVWLIVAAIFIAEGFLITGLGRRIGLWFVSKLGKSTLGLAYGMTLTDLALAPATPSITARCGGVLYPIIRSLSEVRGSTPESDESRHRIGSYLLLTSVQANAVTAGMFLTAMAANPISQSIAAKQGVHITWGNWAALAIVPGLLTLAVVPWVMMKIYPPELKQTPEAPAEARAELEKLGKLTRNEIIMALTFVSLLALWCLGDTIGLDATVAAMAGISVLLITGVLTWDDLGKNASAWSTMIFFAVLIAMADQLNKLGVVGWIGKSVASSVHGLGAVLALVVLVVVYFFAHYLFASNTAQIIAMYGVFLSAATAAGAPALYTALLLACVSNLFGGLTHYASGSAGVIFGSGYVHPPEWFKIGAIMGVVILVVFGGTSVVWGKLIGIM